MAEGVQSTNVLFSCYYRVIGGSQGATINVTSGVSTTFASVEYLIHGFLNGTAPTPSALTTGASNTFPSTAAVNVPSEPTLVISALGWKAGSVGINTFPLGYTYSQLVGRYNNAAGSGTAFASKQVQAAVEAPGTWNTAVGINFAGYTIIVRPETPVTTVIDYTPFLVTLALLILAFAAFLLIAWYDDSVAWFIPAGIVAQFIAFEGWTITTSLYVALSLSVVGIVTLLVPIGHALRGRPS